MTKTTKIAWSIVAGVMLVICFFGWRVYDTWRGIPPLAIVFAMCQGPLRLLWRIDCLRGPLIASRFRRRLRTFSTPKRSMDAHVTLPNHSQASFPGSVALAQLPSRSACSLEAVNWYTDPLEIPISHRGLVRCGRHPNNSMPMTDAAKMLDRSRRRSVSNFLTLGLRRHR
jgi:hypothetical protein